MIVPAVISIFLFGASFLIFTAYYFWRIYSLTQKNQLTSSQGRNLDTEVAKSQPKGIGQFENTLVQPYDSMIHQPNENKNTDLNNKQYQIIRKDDIVNIIELENQQNAPVPQQEQENTQNLPQTTNIITVDPNESQLNNAVPTNRNSIESQISNNTLKQTEDFYAKVQNAYLLISCLVFGQAIISRIFIVKLNNRIDVKDYFYLSAINTTLAIILYNIIYGLLIFMLKNTFVRIPILRFGFIFYGLIMPFPLYNGLSDEIRSDFLIILIAIGYTIIVQGCLQKCKNTQNIITQTELMIV